MTPQESFVTRLRRHRQRNQVSLEEIASATRVKRELLESLENNDLTGWPQGLYARAVIRSYATVVGLDPDEAVDEFCRLYPQGDRRTQGTIRDMAAIVAAPSEYRDEFPHEDRRRQSGLTPSMESEGMTAATSPWYLGVVIALRPVWLRLSSIVPAQKSLRRGLP
jgi:cytoskeletal protein RodZ